MRKMVKITIALSLLVILFIVISKANQTSNEVEIKKSMVKTDSKKLPLFEFYTLDSIPFSKYDLNKDKNLVLIYFDPDCSLCEKSGEVFYSFKKIHEPSQVIFVSHNSNHKIIQYQKKFKLDNVPNITFLRCNEADFFTLFKESSTPTYFIYNKNQELMKVINDDVPVKTILRYIKAGQIDK
ncbi:MAG: hypothetical protein CMO82_05985 [Winogradskyella sp.]|nr:hypothetical protein [Winogradskyella sp.]